MILAGQTPEVAMSSALTAVKFYVQQQRVQLPTCRCPFADSRLGLVDYFCQAAPRQWHMHMQMSVPYGACDAYKCGPLNRYEQHLPGIWRRSMSSWCSALQCQFEYVQR